jgi:hypothetical protein
MLSDSGFLYASRMSSYYTDASLSGPRYGLAASTPRVGRTDISSSGPGYGVRPPRPGAASPTGAGGYSFRTALANDPILRSQLAGVNAGGTANQGALDAQRTSLLANYGAIPANVGFNPTQEARDLANAATLSGVSTSAVENAAYGRQNADAAALATARGQAHSGLVGQYSQQNLDTHNQNVYANQSALLGALGTAQTGYLAQQQALRGQAATYTNDALTRQILAIQGGLIGTGGPAPPRSVTGLPARGLLATGASAGANLRPPAAPTPSTPSGTRGAGQLGY